MNWKTMVASALMLGVLGGCGSGSDDSAGSPPATVPADPRDAFAASAEGGAYLDVMESIHPDLRANRAIGWGQSLCEDFDAGTVSPSTAEALDRIRLRFDGGGRPPLTDEQATDIEDAAISNICPDAE